jgi:hypothetical protein
MFNDCAVNLVKICNAIINGRTDFVSGSRMLRVFYLMASDEDKDLYTPIIGFESETDDYPLGSHRKRFPIDELGKMDESIIDYENRCSVVFLTACRALIKRYGLP